MFLTGTLLNVAAVLLGTLLGVAIGTRMPARLQSGLTTGLGLFTLLIGLSMGLRVLTDPAAQRVTISPSSARCWSASRWASCCACTTGSSGSAAWFQRRLAGDGAGRPSRIAEGFVTASLVFCVGPLTILGSLENGLTGDVTLLAIKSLLDGVASIAFAAALGRRRGARRSDGPGRPGRDRRRRLPAARCHGRFDDPGAVTAAGGILLLGVSLGCSS